MIISTHKNLDACQEAQLAVVTLLKAAHRFNKQVGNGIVSISITCDHTEMTVHAIFEDGGEFQKTESLDTLSFIPKDL